MQWTMEVDERQFVPSALEHADWQDKKFVAVKELNLTGLKIAMMIDKY